MDEKLFKILKKTYYKKSYYKDGNYQRPLETGDKFDSTTMTTFYSTNVLSPEELLYLERSNYPLNDIGHYTHDETIKKLKKILNHPNINFKNIISAYVCGFSSFPRGRQPVISYLFAKFVEVHSFKASKSSENCAYCSMKKEFYLEIGNEIFRKYWGYSWNESPLNYYIDLEEFSTLTPQYPTQDDLKIFFSVIELIRNSPTKESVSKLEQRIKKSKIIPNCEKYRLRGQLITLAELGVMPNPYIKPLYDGFTDFDSKIMASSTSNHRSDVVLPLSGWVGEDKICEERFQEIFGEFSI